LAQRSARDIKALINKDLVAKHVLWLHANRGDQEPVERFLVSGGDDAPFHNVEYEGLNGVAMEALYQAMSGKGRGAPGLTALFIETATRQVHMGINLTLCLTVLDDLISERGRLATNVMQLSQALKNFKIANKHARINGKQRRYTIVDTAKVMEYAAQLELDNPVSILNDRLRSELEKGISHPEFVRGEGQ
jgi:hypothetical protein